MGAFDVFFRFRAARRRFVNVTARIAIRLFINQVLQRKFVFSFYKNTRLYARSDFGSPILAFYLGLYEESSMKFLVKYLRPGDLFVDVGANVGVYTVLAAGVCGARVHAFEPVSLAYRALQDNVSLNQVMDQVTLHKCGVGSQRSSAFITTWRKGSNAISIDNELGPVEEIQVDALDQILAGDLPEMIKIDVEGYEEQVLLGAVRTLASERVNTVIIEGIPRHAGDDVMIERCCAMLASCGFKVCTFDPVTGRVLEAPAGERPFAGPDDENFLFVRDLARARRRLGAPPDNIDPSS